MRLEKELFQEIIPAKFWLGCQGATIADRNNHHRSTMGNHDICKSVILPFESTFQF